MSPVRSAGTGDGDDPTSVFWELAEEFLARGEVEEGKLMGFPCLRVDGEFFATCDHRSGDLIVKLHRDDVAAMVDEGLGEPFAPAGRVFKEWVLVPERDEQRWRSLMERAFTFVSGGVR